MFLVTPEKYKLPSDVIAKPSVCAGLSKFKIKFIHYWNINSRSFNVIDIEFFTLRSLIPVSFFIEFRPSARFLTSTAFTEKNSSEVRGENIRYLLELVSFGVNAIELTLLSGILIVASGLTKENVDA